MDERSRETIRSYEDLGGEYIDNIAGFRPIGVDEFIAELSPGACVLDVGCAGGRDSKTFVDEGFNVVGIDVVDAFLQIARKNVPEARFFNLDVRKSHFLDFFDGVWANAVLLHLPRADVLAALCNLYNALRRGGTMHVSVKRGEGEEMRSNNLSDLRRRFTYFSYDEVEQLMLQAGFSDVRVEPVVVPGHDEASWINCLARK